MIRKNNLKIAVIGLGYVGFPLACLFAKKYSVIGYDIDADKVKNLINGKVGNIDVDIDAKNPRTKTREIPAGIVSKKASIIMTSISSLIFD